MSNGWGWTVTDDGPTIWYEPVPMPDGEILFRRHDDWYQVSARGVYHIDTRGMTVNATGHGATPDDAQAALQTRIAWLEKVWTPARIRETIEYNDTVVSELRQKAAVKRKQGQV